MPWNDAVSFAPGIEPQSSERLAFLQDCRIFFGGKDLELLNITLGARPSEANRKKPPLPSLDTLETGLFFIVAATYCKASTCVNDSNKRIRLALATNGHEPRRVRFSFRKLFLNGLFPYTSLQEAFGSLFSALYKNWAAGPGEVSESVLLSLSRIQGDTAR